MFNISTLRNLGSKDPRWPVFLTGALGNMSTFSLVRRPCLPKYAPKNTEGSLVQRAWGALSRVSCSGYPSPRCEFHGACDKHACLCLSSGIPLSFAKGRSSRAKIGTFVLPTMRLRDTSAGRLWNADPAHFSRFLGTGATVVSRVPPETWFDLRNH